MKEYNIQYAEGDEVYVKGTIQYSEIHHGKVYYKINEASGIIPEDKLSPHITHAYVNLCRGDFSEMDVLQARVEDINEQLELNDTPFLPYHSTKHGKNAGRDVVRRVFAEIEKRQVTNLDGLGRIKQR